MKLRGPELCYHLAAMEPTSIDPRLRIKKLIVERLNLDVDPATIDDSQPLFGEGLGLDSIDALELVLGLEQEFDVRIDDGEMDGETFSSVDRLVDFVAAKRQAKAPEGGAA